MVNNKFGVVLTCPASSHQCNQQGVIARTSMRCAETTNPCRSCGASCSAGPDHDRPRCSQSSVVVPRVRREAAHSGLCSFICRQTLQTPSLAVKYDDSATGPSYESNMSECQSVDNGVDHHNRTETCSVSDAHFAMHPNDRRAIQNDIAFKMRRSQSQPLSGDLAVLIRLFLQATASMSH
jgi:hypothetical protein